MTILLPVILAVIVLLASLFVLQPGFASKLRSRGVPSRTEALIGKTGVVTETIDPTTGTGRVLIAGEDWAAHGRTIILIGTSIHVKSADGIILNVTPAKTSPSEDV